MLERIKEDSILKVNDNYYLSKIEGKNLFWIFDISCGKSFKLNEISYNILANFDGKKDVKVIRDYIMSQYKEDPKNVLSDFDDFMNLCLTKGILKII